MAPSGDAHDPVKWVMVLGRFDAVRWKTVWQDLFDSHTLVHNQRQTRKVEVSEQGDGAFAVVDVAPCGATATEKISIGEGARARSIAALERSGK